MSDVCTSCVRSCLDTMRPLDEPSAMRMRNQHPPCHIRACDQLWCSRNNMKSLAHRLRARLSTQLQPIDQSNLEDVHAHQQMLTNTSDASAGGREATPLMASQTCPFLQSPHWSYLKISSSAASNTESAAVPSLRVRPDEFVAAPTIRDTSFIVRLLTNPFMLLSTFNVPAAPPLRL